MLLQVEGTDDAQEYRDTMDAMTTMGMDTDEQSDVIQVVSGNIWTKYIFDIFQLKRKSCHLLAESLTELFLQALYIILGILHLGNIVFSNVGGGETAEVNMDDRKFL